MGFKKNVRDAKSVGRFLRISMIFMLTFSISRSIF